MMDRRPLYRDDLESYLQAIGKAEDADIDLAESALLLAVGDQEEISLDRYRDHLECLVADTRRLIEQLPTRDGPPRLTDCLQAIGTVLYDLHGYSGDKDNYNNLENANFLNVIDRRKGLPIVLGILYIHIARSLGWNIDGLNFPGHFLLRFNHGKDREIIDPFDKGTIRNSFWLRDTLKEYLGEGSELKTEYCRKVSNRSILLRLQNNVKIRLIEAEDPEKALAVLDQMLLIAPKEASIWREAGMMQAYLNNMVAAIHSLEHYLMIEEDPRGHPEAARLLQKLKTQLN
ncbi:transglutaminase-like domain-containing protein [Kiloniella laminariae]|uniref:Transglutaminase-like domain-containing protein n=1 Tax=Kiloniella laminariae TaxID=454162 RepID=A0ABT4LJE3_9PROT|nr:transglutaminase-like domain-containing protein [Kiloniella laminariae]MCZ4281225.1 transglutaminase-like domain-containing protein [Kiloniella laminariae]